MAFLIDWMKCSVLRSAKPDNHLYLCKRYVSSNSRSHRKYQSRNTVSSLQEKYEAEGYEEKGELVNAPIEENGLTGEMQYYAYPVNGFYVYGVDGHVLVITYVYPLVGGDRMLPLLEGFRKSIRLE
ncbi:hypothetical protein [Oceanobacillus senegalensis]|uniref:hypothetical protein n=1 Tax=Oceanobacillus senegalensis TaxID=1936063 RepID=UPI000A3125DD|nr:hypothetical protein [Oceanobacillus senegalensis]